MRSWTLRYFCFWKLLSSLDSCWSLNAVRALRDFLGWKVEPEAPPSSGQSAHHQFTTSSGRAGAEAFITAVIGRLWIKPHLSNLVRSRWTPTRQFVSFQSGPSLKVSSKLHI